jgi:hypothetical protein
MMVATPKQPKNKSGFHFQSDSRAFFSELARMELLGFHPMRMPLFLVSEKFHCETP